MIPFLMRMIHKQIVVPPSEGVAFQHYRIFMTATQSGSYYQMSEVELLDENGQDILDSSTVADQSTFYASAASYGAAKLLDNDTETKWTSSGNSNTQEWVSFSLTQPRVISAVTITAYSSSELGRQPKNFIIQGSHDNSEWITLTTVTYDPAWSAYEKREYPIDYQQPAADPWPNAPRYLAGLAPGIAYSDDMINWTEVPLVTANTSSFAFSNGIWLAGTGTGILYRSVNGGEWEQCGSITGGIGAMEVVNGEFVFAAKSGNIVSLYRTADGTNPVSIYNVTQVTGSAYWGSGNSPQGALFPSVSNTAYGIFVDNSFTARQITPGLTSPRTAFRAAAYGNGIWMGGGQGFSIVRSPQDEDGSPSASVAWTRIYNVANDDSVHGLDFDPVRLRWVAVGMVYSNSSPSVAVNYDPLGNVSWTRNSPASLGSNNSLYSVCINDQGNGIVCGTGGIYYTTNWSTYTRVRAGHCYRVKKRY